jgi:FtsP/CotA-like multicopper oxidase with cupredoxin domain
VADSRDRRGGAGYASGAGITRRKLVQSGVGAGTGLLMWRFVGGRAWAQPIATSVLDPGSIPKYETPLVTPPAMPRSGRPPGWKGKGVDYYRIAVRQFRQRIMPPSMDLGPTKVWSYGSVDHPATFNYPAFTIEAAYERPVRVKWINDLVKPNGEFRPHLLPIDQTLHWANPPGGAHHRDQHGSDHASYRGPVPIVTHLHGGHSSEESDGYPEAWYLPQARKIPSGYARTGSLYQRYRAQAQHALGQAWTPGSAVFQYENETRARTEWYHDHALGITRANVYAGPAGFYLLRGGPGDVVEGTLPSPAPALGDPPGRDYFEIPIVIQDRSFTEDGELFYPDSRAFFEGLDRSQLQIPFMPDRACGGPSDVAPIWNPEFFGNSIVVNGNTWPYLEAQQRRYRFRFLNGCNARFLILRMSNDLPFWQIGNDGGFLPDRPVQVSELLLGPAERADVIVDFTNVPAGTEIILKNLAPDEPFGGGTPGVDFEPADPDTTGQVMRLQVVPATSTDTSTPPSELGLPAPAPLGAADNTRQVSLNEAESATVRVITDPAGNIVLDCKDGEPFGPVEADLGTVNANGTGNMLGWDEPITETPAAGAVEVWEIHNFTADAHPIHIHEITFEVVNRQPIGGAPRPPDSGEAGRKDTVIAYPGEITRVKALFDRPGLFVWHCHILEHEDNEMMRPYRVGH